MSSIYEAASAPERWPEAVERATEWVGGCVGSLQARRLGPSTETLLVSTGIDSSYHHSYTNHYWQIDPHLEDVAALPVLRGQLSRDVLSDVALRRTEYFNDWCRPQSLHDLQGVKLVQNPHWAATLATFGDHRDAFAESTRGKLEAVAQHFARALRLSFHFDALASAEPGVLASTQLRAVDCVHVDRTSRSLEANPRFGQLATDGAPLVLEGGVLMARHPEQRECLRVAVQRAAEGLAAMLELGTASDRWTIACAPGPRMSPFDSERCVSLVFARNARAHVPAESFNDLPESLRGVARAMALGLSDKEIASELGYSLATARTYVARVLKRLGVSSRRELMRSAKI